MKKLSEVKPREKTIVFTFGRMNPPTAGHQKLLSKLYDTACGQSADDHRVYVSQTQDSEKNPLSYSDKIKFLRHFFPEMNIQEDPSVQTVFHALRKFQDEGFTNVIMVVGKDRAAEFTNKIGKYIKSEDSPNFDPEKDFKFKFYVVSAGERDSEANDVSGMSASKMRQAAASGDFIQFSKGMPGIPNRRIAMTLYDAVRKGMEQMKKNKREDYKYGDIVENMLGERGRVVSIRKTQIAYNILETGEIKADDFDKLILIHEENLNKEEMSPQSKAEIHRLSESYKVPVKDLEKVYFKAFASWKPGMNKMPQQFALEHVKQFAASNINNLFESHLMGTNETLKSYQSMTPGEPGYEPQYKAEDNDPTDDIPADDVGATYNSELNGQPSSAGGLGGAFSIPPNALPKNPRITEWANKPETKKMFEERYGKLAEAEIVKAAHRMNKEISKSGFKNIKRKIKETTGMNDDEDGAPPPTDFTNQKQSAVVGGNNIGDTA